MKSKGFTGVIDATHPFASAISGRSQAIAASLGLPYLQLLRPAWTPGPGDRWTEIADARDAAGHIPRGATVFLATGPGSLDAFSNCSGRYLICRRIDPPRGPFPYSDGEYLVGRPPFSVEDEIRLFEARGVDWLVTKNAGGTASRAKLDAARALGLPVLMIARPPQPPGDKAATPDEAMRWIATL